MTILFQIIFILFGFISALMLIKFLYLSRNSGIILNPSVAIVLVSAILLTSFILFNFNEILIETSKTLESTESNNLLKKQIQYSSVLLLFLYALNILSFVLSHIAYGIIFKWTDATEKLKENNIEYSLLRGAIFLGIGIALTSFATSIFQDIFIETVQNIIPLS